MSGQITLVLGGARSGKSRYAEGLLAALPPAWNPPWVYVATAEAGDAEMMERINVHRARRGSPWQTVEAPHALAEAIVSSQPMPVLVDCLTLWLSNLLLQGNEPQTIVQRVEELASVLARRSLHAVVVSNEVGLGIVPETPLGRTFRDIAGLAHQRISAAADEVYFAVLGTILRIKPSPAFLDLAEITG